MDYNLNEDQSFEDTDLEETPEETHTNFLCPKCGQISRDDVMFLCNTCESNELIHKDGMYICPSCLLPGENFECLLCGSKEVKIDLPEVKN